MLTSDDQLHAAMSWAEGQGLDLNVVLDVVSLLADVLFFVLRAT